MEADSTVRKNKLKLVLVSVITSSTLLLVAPQFILAAPSNLNLPGLEGNSILSGVMLLAQEGSYDASSFTSLESSSEPFETQSVSTDSCAPVNGAIPQSKDAIVANARGRGFPTNNNAIGNAFENFAADSQQTFKNKTKYQSPKRASSTSNKYRNTVPDFVGTSTVLQYDNKYHTYQDSYFADAKAIQEGSSISLSSSRYQTAGFTDYLGNYAPAVSAASQTPYPLTALAFLTTNDVSIGQSVRDEATRYRTILIQRVACSNPLGTPGVSELFIGAAIVLNPEVYGGPFVTSTTVGSGKTLRITQPITTLDFNVQGQSDILWRYYGTGGANTTWYMNNTALSSTSPLPATTNLDWRITSVDDFNRDGKPDILWRNFSTTALTVWLMNGTALSSTASIAAPPDLNWELGDTGDFNSDGNTDIVWHNKVNGTNVVWLMTGTTKIGTASVQAVSDLNWHIVGTGDFNNDNSVDIVWRNYATGADVIWLMRGTVLELSVSLTTVTDKNWFISGTGDYNSDGRVDILWRNYATGANTIWIMDGPDYSSSVSTTSVPDLKWYSE